MIRRFTLLFVLILMQFDSNYLFAYEQKQDSIKSKINIKIDDVEIISSFIKKKGHEAISLSTLYQDDIKNKIGTQEFVEVMKSIPSIYATKKGGGYGDSRIVLRGFSTSNVPVLINGIPANGMENSAVYWSNWAGLSDAAGAIQVQRGVGLSKLGLFSAGGTINIRTQMPTSTPKGQVFYKMGGDGYIGAGASYSSGDLPKGWSFELMGTRTSGDGYVNGTAFEAYTYHG